ncbi:MAG: hypothetical protein G5Z42_06595 [Caldisphaeraceae archaeon]|nr:hypothetical protein [Caldisphaeraceae archaeon]MEB3691745.1 hypothetical protein [Caldisphaeraceae archaeon]MEB3798467.1 hypothetical protein [Caldisphaeraceae archaeon]
MQHIKFNKGVSLIDCSNVDEDTCVQICKKDNVVIMLEATKLLEIADKIDRNCNIIVKGEEK